MLDNDLCMQKWLFRVGKKLLRIWYERMTKKTNSESAFVFTSNHFLIQW